MTSPDPNLHAIAVQTFRLVRKGYDPAEVRDYLQRIEAVVSRLTLAAAAAPATARGVVAASDAATGPLVALRVESGGPSGATSASNVPTDAEVAARREEVAELEHRQRALLAWFEEDGRADPDAVPAEVADASARAEALVHEAQVQVDEMLRDAEAQVSPGGGDRWSDLGEHVARILAQAEQEARAIRGAAEVASAAERQAADEDRNAAREELEQAQQHAASVVDAAERAAADLRLQGVPRARTHIAEVLAEGRAQIEVVTASLRQAHGQLEAVHLAVGHTLADQPPVPTLVDADAFVGDPDPDPDASPGPVPGPGPVVPPGDAAPTGPVASGSGPDELVDRSSSTDPEDPLGATADRTTMRPDRSPTDAAAAVAVSLADAPGERAGAGQQEGVDHELMDRIAASRASGVPAARPAASAPEVVGSAARTDAAWATFLSAGPEAVAADGRLALDEAIPSAGPSGSQVARPVRGGWASRRRSKRS